jgi:hypothetical protein
MWSTSPRIQALRRFVALKFLPDEVARTVGRWNDSVEKHKAASEGDLKSLPPGKYV